MEFEINCQRPDAPYPNENTNFTYYLDEGMNETLNLEFKKGKYRIENPIYYAFPRTHMVKSDMLPVDFHKTRGNQVLNCTTGVQRDTYFVTSVPYQNGMEVYVDERCEVLIMNTAFVGTALEEGNHKVVVKFSPPGKRLGMTMSAVAVFLILLLEGIRIRKKCIAK